jgi:DNA-directed RNA polymerase subunit E'/Rpb7
MLHTESNVTKIMNKNVPGDDKFAIYKIKFTAINFNPMHMY